MSCCFTRHHSAYVEGILNTKQHFDHSYRDLQQLVLQHPKPISDIAEAALTFNKAVSEKNLDKLNRSQLKKLQNDLTAATKKTETLAKSIQDEIEAKGKDPLIKEIQSTTRKLLEREVNKLSSPVSEFKNYRGAYRLTMNSLIGEGMKLLDAIDELSDEYTCKKLLDLKIRVEKATEQIRNIQSNCYDEIMELTRLPRFISKFSESCERIPVKINTVRLPYYICKRDDCLEDLRIKIDMLNSVIDKTNPNWWAVLVALPPANHLLSKGYWQQKSKNTSLIDTIIFTQLLDDQNKKLSELYAASISAGDSEDEFPPSSSEADSSAPEVKTERLVTRCSTSLLSRASLDWTISSNTSSPSIGSPPISPTRLSLQSSSSPSPSSRSPSQHFSRISVTDSPSNISIISGYPTPIFDGNSIILESKSKPTTPPLLDSPSSSSLLDKTASAQWAISGISSSSSVSSPPLTPIRLSTHNFSAQSPSSLSLPALQHPPRINIAGSCFDLSMIPGSPMQSTDGRPGLSQPKSGTLIGARRRLKFASSTAASNSNTQYTHLPIFSSINSSQQSFSPTVPRPLKISLLKVTEGGALPESPLPGTVEATAPTTNQEAAPKFTITITPPG